MAERQFPERIQLRRWPGKEGTAGSDFFVSVDGEGILIPTESEGYVRAAPADRCKRERDALLAAAKAVDERLETGFPMTKGLLTHGLVRAAIAQCGEDPDD